VSRNAEIVILDVNGRERERHRVPYGANLSVGDGDAVQAGQTVARWDALIRPIISEYAGRIRFENVEEGATVTKQVDEATGNSTLVAIESKRKTASSKTIRPSIKLVDEKGREIRVPGTDHPVMIALQTGTLITVRDGQQVEAGAELARVPMESQKNRDITGGLPRVAELFEARTPKDAGMLAEFSGTVTFGKETKGKLRLVITDTENTPHEYLIPKDSPLLVNDGQQISRGEQIIDGPVDPHEILRLIGIEALARYIVDEVQEVYRLQGVRINDKHIEVIVRQMLRRVNVSDPGDTHFIIGEQVERSDILIANEDMVEHKKRPAVYQNVLLGITKASLSTDSFISAASFQETTRVLTEASIMGKRDELRGLKENVIVGRLIPAGTGLTYHKARKVSTSADVSEMDSMAEDGMAADMISSISHNHTSMGEVDDSQG
jgi:DNA-directed RNA polymerase subunit beta'